MDSVNPETLNYELQSFGCKVNTYDSGLLQKRLRQAGFQSIDNAKIQILNTCAVTAEATKEALRRVRRIKRKDPNKFVVVTGCAAQVDTEKFGKESGADLVVANSHKGQLEELIVKALTNRSSETLVYKSNIFKKTDLEPGGGVEKSHTRAFVKIQDGCNSFCTFCVIPFARGKSRSLTHAEIIERINQLHQEGIQEAVLTGVHIGDYAKSFVELADLLEEVLAKTKIPRIRLSSLEPIELTGKLLQLYKNPRLCPHFHMSIQSANSKVLAAMKRKYGAKEVINSLKAIQQSVPGAYVGMDVIAGFPGETEEEHENTLKNLESSPWTRIHVFPYSRRPGTFADRLPEQVPAHIIRRRAQQLRKLSARRFQELAKAQQQSRKQALVLRAPQGEPASRAISHDNWPLRILGEHRQGELLEVEILDVDFKQGMDGVLIAKAFDALY